MAAITEQIGRFVHIEVWGDKSFEYEHFSPEEIATAIHIVYPELVFVTPKLVHKWWQSNANLDTIIKEQTSFSDEQLHLSKVRLAEVLWPSLEQHLIEARENGTLDQIPIARVVSLGRAEMGYAVA